MKILIALLFSANAFALTFSPIEKHSTTAQREKIARSVVKLNETVASQCFSDFISAQKMNQTNGRTPAQVVEHLRSLSGDVPVKMYSRSMRFTSAVAFRQPPHKAINLNSAFFTPRLSDCRWASTIAHEGLGHSAGSYGHSFKWSRKREDTVPYILSGRKKKYGGDVFDKCCRE